LVARAKSLFPDRNFVISNDTYQAACGLKAMGKFSRGKIQYHLSDRRPQPIIVMLPRRHGGFN
jgi:hypothetical protein